MQRDISAKVTSRTPKSCLFVWTLNILSNPVTRLGATVLSNIIGMNSSSDIRVAPEPYLAADHDCRLLTDTDQT
jgi:hypothetical protein